MTAPLRLLFRSTFLFFVVLSGALAVAAQDVPKAKQKALLLAAQEQYYNLRAANVENYSCQVDFDWNGFFAAVAGKPLQADDPGLIYLTGLKIQLVNDLSGKANVTFSESTPLPEGKEGINKLKGSIKEMLDGFVEAWTPMLNGTIIPDNPLVMRKTTGGYLLKVSSDDGSEETLDDTLKLTSLSVKSDAEASTMRTTFTPSPQGLLLTKMEGTDSQPASAPPTAVAMETSYRAVDGYQLPATLMVTVPNVATFKFGFQACTVTKRQSGKD